MSSSYVNLKNLQGTEIKPITDLAAINLTEVNGIAVIGNTIGIRDGYIDSAYYTDMVDPTVGAAGLSSAYVEGGTMFTLIGGYTVTDEIPPITGASHEKVPSEYSVRSAIDALATLGPSLAPGAGIVVETVPGSTGGTIAVAPGDGINVNIALEGGVSVKAGAGISVDSNGVSVVTATNNTFGGIAGAANGVTLVNGVAQVDAGDGLIIDSGKVVIDEASVETTLQDVRIDEGSTVSPVDDQVLTPGNLRGALSVGQAVDVSCAGTRVNSIIEHYNPDYLNPFTITGTASSANQSATFGFRTSTGLFPKRASGLKYLLVCDVCNTGNVLGTVLNQQQILLTGTGNFATIQGVATSASGEAQQTIYTRLALVFGGGDTDQCYLIWAISASVGGTCEISIKNWRQYEVTALTDEAIAYIAQLPDPDAFFRSTSAYSIRDKYLIKQDMVCPFIPTINMPDNSDLTVASGLAYKIKYTNDSPHTITADTIPADAYGQDAHIKMFIKGTSAIHFTEPLVLMNALTPNAGHNISVKFRDGQAFVYVDDTDAGYVVTVASGNTNGTLNYAITGGTTDYAIFSADLDGTTVDAGTVTFVGGGTITTMNILGNGTDKTTITGNISVNTSRTMNFQSLTIGGGMLSGTVVLDDVMLSDTVASSATHFRDVSIMAGSTVTVPTSQLLVPDGYTCKFSGQGTIFIEAGSIMVGTHKPATGGNASLAITGCTVTTGNTSTASLISVNNARSEQQGDIAVLTNCVLEVVHTSAKSVYVGAYGKAILDGCICYGNNGAYGVVYTGGFNELTIINSNIGTKDETVDGNGVGFVYNDNIVNISGCTIRGQNIVWDATHTYNNVLNLSGENKFTGSIYGKGSALTINISDNSVLDVSEYKARPTLYSTNNFIAMNTTIHIGNNFTIKTVDSKTVVVDALNCARFNQYGKFFGNTNVVLVSEDASEWRSVNAIFAVAVDASVANTIKLTDTTFTEASKTLNASRIQLPASTTVSFQGNTNSADTKILDASLIVVGDNPASPSGTATVVNASGTSSTVSGIGTYIDKEGDNDFVANNATNVVPVDASTTGAKYLGTVLSATTGETGANRFAKIDSGVVAVVNEATNAVNKQIITHDYEPILGGTFSLTSATVNETTKTVAIQSGGTMSVVDVRGGKGSVIDLGNTFIGHTTQTTVTAGGIVITGGSAGAAGFGGAFNVSGSTNVTPNLVLSNCIVSGNRAVYGAVHVRSATADIISCTISGNIEASQNPATYFPDLYIVRASANFTDNKLGTVHVGSATAKFAGRNSLENFEGEAGSAVISSGAILDLTGNTNSTPIAPGGGITFEQGGATVLVGGGTASSSYILDNVTLPAGAKLTNTAVVDLNSGNVVISSGTTASASGCAFTSGYNAISGGGLLAKENTFLNLYDCIVSGCSGSAGGAVFTSAGGNFVSCTLVGNSGYGAVVKNGTNSLVLSSTTVSGNSGTGGDIRIFGGTMDFVDCTIGVVEARTSVSFAGNNSIVKLTDGGGSCVVTISSGASINLTSSINPGGGITVLTGGCTVNGAFVAAGSYTSIVSSGGSAVAS